MLAFETLRSKYGKHWNDILRQLQQIMVLNFKSHGCAVWGQGFVLAVLCLYTLLGFYATFFFSKRLWNILQRFLSLRMLHCPTPTHGAYNAQSQTQRTRLITHRVRRKFALLADEVCRHPLFLFWKTELFFSQGDTLH